MPLIIYYAGSLLLNLSFYKAQNMAVILTKFLVLIGNNLHSYTIVASGCYDTICFQPLSTFVR